MAESDKVFAGSIPKFYDALMVPLIFQAYADHMAELVATFSPLAVLETAAGSGALTRALAPRLDAAARYVVTDLNQPMLDYAAARQGADARIEWRRADALALPFKDAAFDLVCCQFGAMFFPDRVAGYIEARRVLRPGGRFVFNVWDRIEENAFADEVTRAVAALFPSSKRSPAIPRPHAAWLSRHRKNPRGPAPCRLQSHRDRDTRGVESRSIGARRRDCLLPGNAATQ